MKPGLLRFLLVLAWAVVLIFASVSLSAALMPHWSEASAYSSSVCLNEFLPSPQSEYTEE